MLRAAPDKHARFESRIDRTVPSGASICGMPAPTLPALIRNRTARFLLPALLALLGYCVSTDAADAASTSAMPAPAMTLNLWPGTPPGDAKQLPPEADQTKDTDKLIAGRRIIKLGNVTTPQLAVYRPAGLPADAVVPAVVICPGGGFSILAYDLEGTEVAEWLNSLGIAGIVLKYRVPVRDPAKRWLAAVQDAQRALSLVRTNAAAWKIDPNRVGILGFSAGGATAGLATLLYQTRQYTSVDAVDAASCRPDASLLVYPAYFVDQKTGRLNDEIKVPAKCPPLFFVHAWNDSVSVLNSLVLAAEVKRAGGTAALHVYPTGGHGYGLRRTEEAVTTWPERATEWLRSLGWTK